MIDLLWLSWFGDCVVLMVAWLVLCGVLRCCYLLGVFSSF